MPAYPLCVDLDETLTYSDSFYTGLWLLLTRRPWLVFALLRTWQSGRPAAKAWLTKQFPLDPARLPYRTALVDYLRTQQGAGRALYLVSAADDALVQKVAAHLGFFTRAFGSTGQNLKGPAKAALIKREVGPDFCYAGDCGADFAVWQHASAAILCGKAVAYAPRLSIPIEASFPGRTYWPIARNAYAG